MSHTETADVSRYTSRVTWSVEDDEFVATCAEFPSLSWLADSQPAALQGLVDLIADTVADLVAESEAVPEPLSERSYSGKFNLRVGESLHRRLAIQAAEEHLSLNQYVIRCLSEATLWNIRRCRCERVVRVGGAGAGRRRVGTSGGWECGQ